MINVEIIKVCAGQILPCGQVTGNKEFTVGSLIYKSVQLCMEILSLHVGVNVYFRTAIHAPI